MVGNRDFMLGQAFAKRTGSTLISEPEIIDLYGYKTLLLHGDSLCIDDVSYQKYRRWTRIKILQWLFLALPAKYRQRISDQIKQKSREQKQYKSAQIMDVNQSEVIRVMNTYDVQVLIHGHTHRPYIHQLNLEENQKTRIVLGDWDSGEPSYLKCSEHGFELVDHRIISSN
jgi:UDP-2,3-diacylglucosamine hydrolase